MTYPTQRELTPLLVRLATRYQEPHRYYHNLEHIEYMLRNCPTNLSLHEYLAVWYHDAIYDPESKTNEEDSAELARNELTPLIKSESFERVVDMVCNTILNTKKHILELTPSSALVLDLDLMSLARPYKEYRKDSLNIRIEYRHVPEEDWLQGRKDWIKSMLFDREHIYTTQLGYSLEVKARFNLIKDLEGIECGDNYE
jgi:predicted metal-dependent HD superfamily phosphohydrolase